MKAVVIHAARDLRVEEREPEASGAGQVEVAIEGRRHLRIRPALFQQGRLRHGTGARPMILGHEVAGTIKALGAAVSGLTIGERVAVLQADPAIFVTIA